jgi:LysR family transcriptional regulator, nod-box dependent transcriptional activator
MRNFDLNLLSSLDALLVEKNVTRAARRANVTQSTMSGILRRLRDQFDDELLIRNGRGYELSPLGQSLAKSVRQILLQIESTVSRRPSFDPRTDERRFRIMASDYETTVYLSGIFERLAKLAPHLSYDIVPIDSPAQSIRSGLVDMCITGADDIRDDTAADGTLRFDALFSERCCCVVDQTHPLDGAVSLAQLFQYPHVLAEFAGAAMAASSLEPLAGQKGSNPIIRVPTFSVIPSLVSGTQAIGVLPSRLLETLPAKAKLRKLETDFEMPSFTEQLLWHARFARDPGFGWLRAVMLERLANVSGQESRRKASQASQDQPVAKPAACA